MSSHIIGLQQADASCNIILTGNNNWIQMGKKCDEVAAEIKKQILAESALSKK